MTYHHHDNSATSAQRDDHVAKQSNVLKLLAFWAIFFVGMGEIGTRLFVTLPIDYVDVKTTCFRYDQVLGWFPKEATISIHSAKFKTEISSNADGFRDRDHNFASETKSMAFLGDSFVWGYDVAADQRFTSNIQAFLPNWTILNMGVSGYGTDQEYLLLQQWYPSYTPDIVFLVVHSNDSTDNPTNYRGNYYKPYFEMAGDRLILGGTPVPRSYRYQQVQYPLAFRSHFVRGSAVLYNLFSKPKKLKVPDLKLPLISAMNDYVTERGSQFRVIFTYAEEEENQYETSYLEAESIRILRVPAAAKFGDHGKHWTAKGHTYVAAKVLEQLYRDGVIVDDDIARIGSQTRSH